MRFKSPTENPIFVALTSGHTAQIGPEYGDLPEIFHREAIANGAVPEPAPGQAKIEADKPPFDRKVAIAEAMNAMLDGSMDGDFTADGKPDLGRLSARVGFTVSRDERDAIWINLIGTNKPPAPPMQAEPKAPVAPATPAPPAPPAPRAASKKP